MTETKENAGEIHALLGRGTEFRGKLVFDGNVRIDGRFEGEIHSDDTLVVGDSAEVVADVHVGTLIVRGGVLRGEIRAKKSVEVYAPGKVYGNITSPQVFIDKGVTFEGQCRMTEIADE